MNPAVLGIMSAMFLLAQTPSEVEITAEPHHHFVLENKYIRVFSVDVPPKDQTLMHRHRHDYMFVSLGETNIENAVAGKAPVTLKLRDGEVKFASGGFAHIAKNLADNTHFRNVSVELMQDGKAPAHQWPEERDVHVLHGGTEDLIFVKDGVRVSEVDLQVAGAFPRHRHITPSLIIAVSDLTLRNDVEGKPPANIEMKAGDVKWVPSAVTHTLTNVGDKAAKWIVLEFP